MTAVPRIMKATGMRRRLGGLAAGLLLLAGCSSWHADLPTGAPANLLPEQQRRTGVRFTTDTRSFTVSPWDVRYQPLKPAQQQLRQYLGLFEQEFQKLPAQLLQLSGLQTVAFVRQLQLATQPRAAVPDYIHEVLYYDISPQREAYLRHVVHHEFYHMLEQQLYGTAYYQDPAWLALNPAGFAYGNGGAMTRQAEAAAFSHPAPGFLNGYAMSGIEEDKAEIWTVIWASDSWQQVNGIFAQDPVLAAKLRLLIKQLQCKAPDLQQAWPRAVAAYLPIDNECPELSTKLPTKLPTELSTKRPTKRPTKLP